MKPKTNRSGDRNASGPMDRCQTPAYALDPLLPYLSPAWTLWEPACGEGLITAHLWEKGFRHLEASDILTGQNFFTYQPAAWDVQVTNPPYSIKFPWIKRSYELGKPFALLVPVETIGAQQCQRLMAQYGAEIMLLDRRINFKMPHKGWHGSAAQFPVLWFCHGLLPEPILYGHVTYPKANAPMSTLPMFPEIPDDR